MTLKDDVELLTEQGPILQEGLCWQTMPKVLELLRDLEGVFSAGEKGDSKAFLFYLRRVHEKMVAA